MITNRDMRDALVGVRELSGDLIEQLDLMPNGLDREADVSEEWMRQFVQAVAKVMVLVTETPIPA